MPRYTLRQLEYLVACIDTGSLVAAADQLNVSQPSISTALAKLENALGVQLLIRHHAQGVVPTANAKTILQSARELLSHANELEQLAAASGETLAGELHLGSFISLAPAYLPGLIARLGHVHPNLRLNVAEGTQLQLLEGLRNGQLHAALLYDLGLPDGLRLTELIRLKPHVLLPSTHPLAKRKKIELQELVDEPLILLDVPPSRQYFVGMFDALGLKPQIGYTSPSVELVRGLVGRGLGYALLVTRPPGDVTYDGQPLAIRKLKDPVEASRVVLCSLEASRQSRAMSAFEDVAIRYFSELQKPPAH